MVWDGTSLSRPDSSVIRAPDGHDWAKIVDEVQNVESQSQLFGNADENLVVGSVLTYSPTGGIIAASTDRSCIVGMADADFVTGDPVTGVTQGSIERSDWTPVAGAASLTRGVDYYLRDDGKISTSPPTTGWVHKVGYAISSTVFVFQKQLPVRL